MESLIFKGSSAQMAHSHPKTQVMTGERGLIGSAQPGMHKQIPETPLSLLHLDVAALAVILRSSRSQRLPSSNMNWGGRSLQVQV